MQFFVNVLEVPFDGGDGDAEAVGNGLIAKTLHHQFEDFALAVGKVLHLGGGGGLLAELADDLAGDFRGHGHAALVGLADGGDNFFRLGAFEEVAAGAGAQRLKNLGGVCEIASDAENGTSVRFSAPLPERLL